MCIAACWRCCLIYRKVGWVHIAIKSFFLDHQSVRESINNDLEASTSQAATSTTVNVPRPRIPVNIQVEEHRRLFGYTGSGRGKYSAARRGKEKSKAKKQNGPTCTLKFVCLASCNAIKPPTSVKERAALSNAGLGDTSITFDVNGDSSHCHEKILESFPKLCESGYNLMLYDRAGENSSFCPLNHPYLPRKLKEVAGQCKIYIRPLQKDLVDSDTEEEIEVCSFPLCICR